MGMGGILTGFGFAPYAYRARFVRHVVATARKTAPVAFPAVEVGQVLSRSVVEGDARGARRRLFLISLHPCI